MNTLKNNKLIAEFMGVNPTISGDEITYEMYGVIDCIEDGVDEQHFFLEEQLLFHTHWDDWLRPVVDKMHTYGCEVVISSNGVTTIYAPSGEVLAEESSEDDMHDATYKAIVKVLKEHLHKPC